MYLSTDEAAHVLGFQTHHVRRWCSSGLIKSTFIPGPSGRKRHYIHRDKLLEFAASMKLDKKIIAKIKGMKDEGNQPGSA